jgi:hypothetical protein
MNCERNHSRKLRNRKLYGLLKEQPSKTTETHIDTQGQRDRVSNKDN